MGKRIILAKYNDASSKKDDTVYCVDLEKNDYDTKYKGRLTCIKGCKARVKFTERKNGFKFFSTWNGDGELHDEGCPYSVEYRGQIGRKKLEAFYKAIDIDEDEIAKRLRKKAISLKKEYSDDGSKDPDIGSNKVEHIGNGIVEVEGEGDGSGEENKGRKGTPHIKYEDASYVTVDDIGRTIAVYGVMDNIQLCEESSGKKYAYINFKTKFNTTFHVMLPEAFYSNEYSRGEEEFKHYIDKIKIMKDSSLKEITVIAYGEITKKKKREKGVNITIISPKRIYINELSYDEVLRLKK